MSTKGIATSLAKYNALAILPQCLQIDLCLSNLLSTCGGLIPGLLGLVRNA